MEVKSDLFGDPLPFGALVRLGTIRLRQGSENFAVAFSPDGRLIASGGCDGRIFLWEAATGRRVRVFKGHKDKLYHLAWAPHGRWLASIGRDNTIRLWDPSSARQLVIYDSFKAEEPFPTTMAISPDSRRLAWADYEGGCHLWDMTSSGWKEDGGGRPPAEIWRGSTESGPAFLPDAVPDRPADWLISDAAPDRSVDRMVTVVDRTLRFHGLEGGGVVRTLTLDEPFDRDRDDLVPCPAGHLIAVMKGARSELILLDVRSGEIRHRFPNPGRYPKTAWSPDGRILATYVGEDEGIHLWSVASGERLRVINGPRDWACALAFSPDGRVLAAALGGHPLWLCDVATGERILDYAANEDAVHSVAFSLDGRYVATGGWHAGEVATWDAATGRRLQQFRGHETGRPGRRSVRVAYHPDGRRLVTWSESGIRIYDLAAGEELRHEPFDVYVASGPGDEVYAIAYDDSQNPRTLRFRGLSSGRDLIRIPLSGERVHRFAFDPVNQVFAVALQEEKPHTRRIDGGGRIYPPAGLRRTVQWWALRDGTLLHTFDSLAGSPTVMRFSSDGRLLVAACEDRQIRAWDVASGELRVLGPEGTSEKLVISSDGRTWVTSSDEDRIIFWDAAEGRPRATATSRHVSGMILSPDGDLLVTGEYDEGIVLRDVGTGALRTRLAEREKYYDTLAFSPDGSVLAADCDDTSVLLWDFRSIRHRAE